MRTYGGPSVVVAMLLAVAPMSAAEDVGDSTATIGVVGGANVNAAGRSYQLEDTFRIEPQVKTAIFSGDRVAFVRTRPRSVGDNPQAHWLGGSERSDVWVQFDHDSDPVNVTNGESDSSGWWAPKWSPDGARLAMLATRGGNVRVWIFDLHSRKVRMLSDRAVDYAAGGDLFEWDGSNKVVLAALPEGQLNANLAVALDTPLLAGEGWRRMRRNELAVSKLGTGERLDRANTQLLDIDVEAHAQRTLAEGPIVNWALSSTNADIGVAVMTDRLLPSEGHPLTINPAKGHISVEIVHSATGATARTSDGCFELSWAGLTWSKSGDELAYYCRSESSGSSPWQLRVAKDEGGRIKSQAVVGPPLLGTVRPIWLSEDAIAVKSESDSAGRWWRVSLASPYGAAPIGRPSATPLAMVSYASVPFAVESGRLWRVDADGSFIDVTPKDMPAIGDVLHVVTGGLIIQSRGAPAKYWLLASPDDRTLPVASPDPEAVPLDCGRQTHDCVFSQSGHAGSFLWRVPAPGGALRVLAEANKFLSTVSEGTTRIFSYKGREGRLLYGRLYLPPGLEGGRRLPLVVRIYPGVNIGADGAGDPVDTVSDPVWLSAWLFAGQGYAVLDPSIPLGPEGSKDDPMIGLASDVLPAIDDLVASGVVDDQHLFLVGHSFGGYGVYGLLTQTNRFHAAVAAAATSDLVSLYGEFMSRRRYSADPVEDSFFPYWAENGQGRMGSPPWIDPERYARNSPILQADKIHTPVLIIQGDLDYVSIGQGEEMYSALHRLGRRVRFLRYWGEDHIVNSVPDVRDMWAEIFSWFRQAEGGEGARRSGLSIDQQ